MGKIDDFDEYRRNVFPNIGFIKPMIICSDNHDPRKYEPSNYLWIKSDLTFNGLKQICYEPEERVFVSEERPQCNAAYQVIKYVQISDSDFSSEKIYFNPYLTCIIGGKSTGKSLLLHNMAKKLDEDQIKEKEAIANFKTKDVQDIKIIWDDNEENNERAIVYIPQSYLNSLADEKEKATEIDEMISKIVFSNEGCRELKEQLENKTQLISNEIRTLINELFNCYVTKNSAEEERANIGDERGVKKEIDSIKKELEKLSEKSELSEEEIEKYQNAVENTAKLENEISSISNDEHILETITTVVRPFIIENNLSSSTKYLLNTGAKEVISFADKKWLEEKRKIVEQIVERKNKCIDEKESYEKTIKEFEPKIRNYGLLVQESNRLKVESEKYESICKYKERIDDLNASIDKKIINKEHKDCDLKSKQLEKQLDVLNTLAMQDEITDKALSDMSEATIFKFDNLFANKTAIQPEPVHKSRILGLEKLFNFSPQFSILKKSFTILSNKPTFLNSIEINSFDGNYRLV